MKKRARASELQLPLWIDSGAPERICPRCKVRMTCVSRRDYGVFTEWTYVGCGCYKTRTNAITTPRKG
jgi:hypothetical protein